MLQSDLPKYFYRLEEGLKYVSYWFIIDFVINVIKLIHMNVTIISKISINIADYIVTYMGQYIECLLN